jgi:IclR family transcriptional regulator, KDG regulon repressor
MKLKKEPLPSVVQAPISSVRSVSRSIDILEELANNPRGIGLLELSKRIGLHKSTAFRLLSVLAERGYVQKSERGQGYTLGLHLVELSNCYINSLDLKIEARPCMYELTEATRHTVFLALLHDREVVYIDKTETFTSLRRFAIIGTRVPVHCTSLGKALLMEKSATELEAFLKDYDFRPLTPKTLTSFDELMRSIEEARKNGFTLDDEENEQGVRCVGHPVYDYSGKVIAAMSVSGLADVFTREKVPEIGQKVRNTALEISRRMGYQGHKTNDKESLLWKNS